MMRLVGRIRQNERGAAAALVALAMVVVLGCTGLAIDVGRMVSERRELVTIADAAALAGAYGLPDSDAAKNLAISYAQKNGYALAEGDVVVGTQEYNGEDMIYVSVGVNRPVGLTFIRFLGFEEAAVGATAKAIYGHPLDLHGGGILPFFVKEEDMDEYVPYQDYIVKVGAATEDPENEEGNFRCLNLSGGQGGGSSEFEQYLSGELEADVEVGDHLFTFTGNNVGKTLTGMDARMGDAESVCGCIPVVSLAGQKDNGSYEVIVEGFAVFEITRYNDGDGNTKAEIYGHFLEEAGSCNSGANNLTQDEAFNYGIKIVKLIE